MIKTDYDAIIIGSGPNGLAAAITMQQAGLSVLVIEGKDTIGGGLRTAQLTLPGYLHDICSAIHPLAVASPFFQTLPLQNHGLEYIYPPLAAAHPYENGSVAVLTKSIAETAQYLESDREIYTKLMESIVAQWPKIANNVLGPLAFPHSPLEMAQFGLKALPSARWTSRKFATSQARGLWAGMCAHSMQPLSNLATSAIGLVLMAAAHLKGWPVPKGGSQSIANALASYFRSLGGTIQTDFYVRSLKELPSWKALLFDITPKQMLQIAGHSFSSIYQWQLKRYRYGVGVYKIDWALDGPVPFTNPRCMQAGTVHLGNTFEEIAHEEKIIWKGVSPQKPFVLLAQPSSFDSSRAPEGKHTIWGYCHVPSYSRQNMTEAIEKQVERFAPGFRERILACSTMDAVQMEEYNPNYVGGDINGGVIDIGQLFTRPVLRLSPYRTSTKGMYVCSSSTPPGGGVHGLCGYYAARRALKDVFNLKAAPLHKD